MQNKRGVVGEICGEWLMEISPDGSLDVWLGGRESLVASLRPGGSLYLRLGGRGSLVASLRPGGSLYLQLGGRGSLYVRAAATTSSPL
jgi:hypothetical protein